MSTPFVLETARQRLRPTTRDDAEALYLLNADDEVRRFTHDEAFASLEEARAFATAYERVYVDEGFARWGAFDRFTNEFLGWCGLRRQPSGDVDLGYRYRRAVWGHGLATEAARACIDYAFTVLALPRIVASADRENFASIRVLEKLGFTFERFEAAREGHVDAFYVLSRSARTT